MLFLALNNGANISNLTSANISNLHCMIYFNTVIPLIVSESETPTNAYSIRSGTKITVSTHYFNAKRCLHWRKLLVNLSQSLNFLFNFFFNSVADTCFHNRQKFKSIFINKLPLQWAVNCKSLNQWAGFLISLNSEKNNYWKEWFVHECDNMFRTTRGYNM